MKGYICDSGCGWFCWRQDVMPPPVFCPKCRAEVTRYFFTPGERVTISLPIQPPHDEPEWIQFRSPGYWNKGEIS